MTITNKKNILIVSHGAALGGSPISGLNIARYINQAQFSVHFAYGEEGKIRERAEIEGFPTTVIKKHGALGLRMIAHYVRYLRKHRIDLVHLNTLTSYYKYPGIAAKLLGIPVVWFIRENPEEKRCVRLQNYLNRISEKIVTVSNDTAQHMPYADNHKLMTIHNGVDLQLFQPTSAEQAFKALNLVAAPYITTVASLEQRKGILELIEAYAELKKIRPAFKLLIVGRDRSSHQHYYQSMQQRIAELQLEQDVVLFGESSDISSVMAATQIFVLSSYWEGLSRVLLEALACGKPIVASFDGGNKEQVFDGVNGYTFKAGDAQALTEQLIKITDNQQQLQQFADASRQIAEQQFDIQLTTQKIEQLYESVLKNH